VRMIRVGVAMEPVTLAVGVGDGGEEALAPTNGTINENEDRGEHGDERLANNEELGADHDDSARGDEENEVEEEAKSTEETHGADEEWIPTGLITAGTWTSHPTTRHISATQQQCRDDERAGRYQ